MIELEEVTKSYRGPRGELLLALDRVSFVARPGRVTALLGRNGAGKTTALRIVSTILAPTSGRARVLGHDTVAGSAAVRRQVGFLSPSIGTFDRLTPAEVIEFFGEMHDLSPAQRARRRVELTERLDLGALLERSCGTLSTGEKQRVQLARALVHEPPVIVLDEPTVRLDVVVARALRETRAPSWAWPTWRTSPPSRSSTTVGPASPSGPAGPCATRSSAGGRSCSTSGCESAAWGGPSSRPWASPRRTCAPRLPRRRRQPPPTSGRSWP